MVVRDCLEIDTQTFEMCELVLLMSDTELGRLFRKIHSAYLSGDLDFIRSLPFIRKAHPRSRSVSRRKKIPIHIRREVLASGPCVMCGTFERLTVDHIFPVSLGGKDHRGNLQPMCLSCNVRKLNRI